MREPTGRRPRTLRAEISPELWDWAIRRAGKLEGELRRRFPKLDAWRNGQAKPTLKQVEAFAEAARVPLGYLFLSRAPEEKLPIPDLRTVSSRGVHRPSPDLLDTIYLCQRRQEWYKEYAQAAGEEPRAFVGAMALRSKPGEAANAMRCDLGLDTDLHAQCRTWQEAIRLLIEKAEEAGVLVMVSGVVGTNNRRPLSPEEFRGFALVDRWAPLIFINGADSRAAQMFTLAHELAHIWLGKSALSDASPAVFPTQEVERWCNAVAAEFLVPAAELHDRLASARSPEVLEELEELVRYFKVSKLVILRRLLDTHVISRSQFRAAYTAELARLKKWTPKRGGHFYRTHLLRVGRRFAHAVIRSTAGSQTLLRDALRMLGLSNLRTLRSLAQQIDLSL